MERIFYVYTYKSLISNDIIWVGKGKSNRCFDHIKGRSCNRILRAHILRGEKYLIELVQKDLAEDEAFKLETKLVKKYGRVCDGTGTLYNLTTGGEGRSGYKYTEKDIIQRYKNRRIVKLENILTGEIKEWQSLGLASREIGTSQSNIWSLLQGKAQTMCGVWKLPKAVITRYQDRKKPIIIKDLQTDTLTSYNSQQEAAIKIEINSTMISLLVRGRVKTLRHGRYILLPTAAPTA
jgi:hypothetical protein